MESLASLGQASILVTGAGGSIGSALSLRLAAMQPKRLVLLDASEQALHRLQSALRDAALSMHIHLMLASVTDRAHLAEIFEAHRPMLIVHAAAYKHVPLLEEHPLEAIANNTLGTLVVSECARDFGAARLVLLSTDKAVEPISILGASKRIAERIVLAFNGIVLRLGNVLGTEGSVSETFLRQIATGGPLTLTVPDAERFFLTCEEAVDLLLSSATEAEPGSLLVPQLNRQHKIATLADFLLRESSTMSTIPVVHTQTRPGDKLREALWSKEEQPSASTVAGCTAIKRLPSGAMPASDLEGLQVAVRNRNLIAAMRIVQRLVPAYVPSPAVLALLEQGALQP